MARSQCVVNFGGSTWRKTLNYRPGTGLTCRSGLSTSALHRPTDLGARAAAGVCRAHCGASQLHHRKPSPTRLPERGHEEQQGAEHPRPRRSRRLAPPVSRALPRSAAQGRVNGRTVDQPGRRSSHVRWVRSRTRTRHAAGVRLQLRPHAFRTIAASSTAEMLPEQVGIIREILGHATLEIAERHYIRVSNVRSCRSYQAVVADLRKGVSSRKRPKRRKR